MSKYNDILKNCPKAKTYIRQIALIYPISKKTIEKLINARQTIEHHFADTYEQNIIYGINQCFRFNKSRPSPAQVIAMITGDSIAELKQKEMDKNKSEKTELEKCKAAKEKYEALRKEALENYKNNPTTAAIRQRFKIESEANSNMYDLPIKVLYEIMGDFINIQAHILSYGMAKLTGYGLGITSHFSKISTKPKHETKRLLDDCFTMYLRSKQYREQVMKSGVVRTEVPTAFVEYVEELIAEHKKYGRR